MDAAKFSFLVLVVLYAVLGAELLVAPGIARLGIVPRTQAGLVGIVFSPLLHASLAHLNANAVPLFALLVLLLTNAEYRVLQTLILEPGASVSREDIASALGKSVGGYDDRSIDAVMARLRRKVQTATGEALPIRAVRSVGYVFAAQVDSVARGES